MDKRLIFLFIVFFAGCQRQNENKLLGDSSEKNLACELTQGDYIVQAATHHQAQGTYELMLLGAPGCLKQPVVLSHLKLERLDEHEKEKAKLRFQGKDNASLLLAQDFQINLVESVTENNGAIRERSSSWSPFMAGAAGAVVGGIAGSAISSALSRRANREQPNMAQQPQKDAAQQSQKSGFFRKKTTPENNHAKIYQRKYTPRSGGSFFKRRR